MDARRRTDTCRSVAVRCGRSDQNDMVVRRRERDSGGTRVDARRRGETLDAEGSDSRQEARKTTLSALFLADGKYPTSWSVGVTRSARAPCRLLHANPLTLASALPIALVLHVKNRVAEERRRARRRARLEDQLVQAGKLRDRLVALVRAAESAAAEDHGARVTFLLRAATGAVAPRRDRTRGRPPSSSFAARARFASPSSPPPARDPRNTPTLSRASPRSSPRPPTPPTPPSARSTTFPPRSPRSNSSLETIGANPRRARDDPSVGDDPGPGPGPGPAFVATSPLARGFPPLSANATPPSPSTPSPPRATPRRPTSQKNLRVIARDATDALVDAFLGADDSGSRRARRALLAAADASFAVAAPLLASCARAVRRVVAELDERWRTTRGEGGTEARGERSRDMNVNGPFVSAARLESIRSRERDDSRGCSRSPIASRDGWWTNRRSRNGRTPRVRTRRKRFGR